MIFGVVAIAVVGGGFFVYQKDAGKKKQAQAILDAGGRFAERDKADMGQFWNCVMGSEVDVGMFNSGDQIQQRIESAYFTQQKTYSEHLTTECVPKLEGARGAIGGHRERHARRRSGRRSTSTSAALPKMQSGLESYAEKLKSRGAVKDVDRAFRRSAARSPPTRRPSRWRSRSSWSAPSPTSTRRRTSRACWSSWPRPARRIRSRS